jgi:hypothetical protein
MSNDINHVEDETDIPSKDGGREAHESQS